MSSASVFLGRSVSDDLAPDVVTDFDSDAVVFKSLVDSATLPFSVFLLKPTGVDDVTERRRLPRTSGDFLPPFTVTVFGECAVGRTAAARCVYGLSTSGVCEISAVRFCSVPLTSGDVFSRLVSETVRVDDVRSCSVEGSIVVVSDSGVANLSITVDLGGGEAAERAVWSRC